MAMPSKYKLVYFNARGRAEVPRLLFAQAGVEYEDCRVTSDEFKAMKGDTSKLPLGQLPVLIVDDNIPIPQSQAITRHLARRFGLYGKDERDSVRVDIVCECIVDITSQLIKIFFEKDEAKKAEMGKNFVEKDSVTLLTAMCDGLKRNSDAKGFCVGDTMTLADIAVFNMTESLFNDMPVLAEKYPILKDFNTRMKAQPKIAAWLAKRPETPF